MIEITYADKTCRFDDEGVNPEKPGTMYGPMLQGKFYEHAFLDYIASLRIPGVYVDVGACIGTHTVFFALHCPSDRVYAFEPRSVQRERLQRNVELNSIQDKVQISSWALADREGTVRVSLDRQDHTLSTCRLDLLLKRHVAVVKLDIEGMEALALKGARKMLRRHRPLVFAEAHTEDEKARIFSVLRPYGYQATGRVFNASPTYEFAVSSPYHPLKGMLRRAAYAAPPPLKRMLPHSLRRRIRRILE
ncbi:FkbM family methyltransferase [Streptomyces sp. NBC_01017]|uniref:FkbM family methyltransferase n=1 Tax=Streptomyces sp. NBC_01017 TaxID=2903721 RepID=UPI0038705683|nr:FkbM family methyltransferase [Streptomyces sp. NBC_01017]